MLIMFGLLGILQLISYFLGLMFRIGERIHDYQMSWGKDEIKFAGWKKGYIF